jgi:hypothetical protein
MVRKSLMRAAAFALLSAGLAAGAYAQVTFSGGYAFSGVYASYDGDSVNITGSGGNICFDFLLPIGIPLSLGGEIGFNTASQWGDTFFAIPIVVRAAYHFDLLPKLDLYLVGKVGYTFGWDDYDSAGGLGFGVDAGVAYYFNSKLGLFAEGGYDSYSLEVEGGNNGYEIRFSRFFTIGLSVKIGRAHV